MVSIKRQIKYNKLQCVVAVLFLLTVLNTFTIFRRGSIKSEILKKKIQEDYEDLILESTVLYKCYNKKHFNLTNVKRIPDLLGDIESEPRPDETIFFHVTNCLPRGLVTLTPRQACAIESAAAINPELDVFVIFSSPAYIQEDDPDSVVQSILEYENVHLRYSDPWVFTKFTPAEEFFNKGDIFKSPFYLAHMSDLLRILSLWKWGGIYIDLDFILTKTFSNIVSNFVVQESDDLLANSILSFKSEGLGHEIADAILKDFVINYRGDIWAHNGPSCVTRVFENGLCQVPVSQMTPENCLGFQVLPSEDFFPIGYHNVDLFFDENFLESGEEIIENSIGVHVWNKLSSGFEVEVGSNVLYGVLAEQYCPIVYSSCGDLF
ncbi:hypothetical protein ACFFRR_006026 [Megaselia abdita]